MGFNRSTPFMVLVFCLLFLFSPTPSFGQDKSSVKKDKAYRLALMAYRERRFGLTLKLLRAEYDLMNTDAPSGVLLLAAFSFQKLGNLTMARRMYEGVIKDKFSEEHEEIMQSYEEDGVDDLPDIPEKLGTIYEKLAIIYETEYIDTYQSSGPDKRERLKEQTLKFNEICIEMECGDEELLEDSANKIEKFDTENIRRKYHLKKFLSYEYFTWKDRIKLLRSSGEEEDLLTTNEANCLGGGVNYTNFYWEYRLSGCLAYGSATVGNDTPSTGYFQKDVTVYALVASPGAFWRPKAGQISLGFETPMIYRKGDYTSPGSGFSLEDTSLISFGWAVKGTWQWEKLELFLRAGKFVNFRSSHFSLGLAYGF